MDRTKTIKSKWVSQVILSSRAESTVSAMSLQQHFKVMQLALLFFTLLVISVHAEPGPSWSSKSEHYYGSATTLSSVTLSSKISTSTISSNLTSTTSTSAAAIYTAPVGTLSKPKVLLIGNTFEFTYLTGFNFTTAYTGPLLDSVYACTSDGEICKLECGQELVSAQQITALLLIPGMDFTETYTFITGTGGVNPKYGTAGGACISQYSVQREWGSMFLGSDLPANFSSQYFYLYAEASPSEYPSLVGTEVYELNEALVDRFYDLHQHHHQRRRQTLQHKPRRPRPRRRFSRRRQTQSPRLRSRLPDQGL
ncbi:purine nucleoside permease-domain-containing protein [Delphinella strobiligena]|nr:purine nucleoside permease-domain-containing protein [Delphinella strobiligena]